MPVGITELAHALRLNGPNGKLPVTLGHRQQVVAAALGYKSLAAYQAAQRSEEEPLILDAVTYVVPDAELLECRLKELGLHLQNGELDALVATAFSERLPRCGVFASYDALLKQIRQSVSDAVLEHADIAGAISDANHAGVSDVYFELNLDLENGNLKHLVFVSLDGHVDLEPDFDRPFAALRVDFVASVVIPRRGRRGFGKPDIAARLVPVKLVRLEEDHEEEGPPLRSLAEALAEELGIESSDAEHLVDVEPMELTGSTGDMTYGFRFDFTEEAPPWLAAKIQASHGSLTLEVGPNFFEDIFDPDLYR